MAVSILGHTMAVPLIYTIIVLVVVIFLKKQASKKIDLREPPVIPSTIPYVGHIGGMLLYGSSYFKNVGSKYPYPIFTLPNLSSRLYIVTDPSLAISVQRATKSLSFNPVIPPVLQRVPGIDKATADLIKSDMTHGFVQQVQERVHAKLGQGEYLDRLTLQACNEFLYRIQQQQTTNTDNVDLLKWVKELVTVSTAAFFYGPNNPIEKDPKLIDQFWDFDAGIPGLLVGFLPWLTARKAFNGREALVKALTEYLNSPQYIEAADITKERTEIARQFGVNDKNTARSDLTFFFAGIINTSLTTFWMILHIFADPHLLSQIRSELETSIIVTTTTDTDSMHLKRSTTTANQDESQTQTQTPFTATLNIKKVVHQSSLLNAVFKEVLRLYSDNFATRVVLSDTLLADTYFLRAGSIVQISGGIIHADSRIWGDDVGEFRPQRFLNASTSTTPTPTIATTSPTTTKTAATPTATASKDSAKDATRTSTTTSSTQPKPAKPNGQIHPAAFRAFGGGTTLCPGRHFAQNEILTLTALIILLLDIEAPAPASNTDSGLNNTHRKSKLQIPRKNDTVIPIHVLEPVRKVDVRMKKRASGLAAHGLSLEI